MWTRICGRRRRTNRYKNIKSPPVYRGDLMMVSLLMHMCVVRPQWVNCNDIDIDLWCHMALQGHNEWFREISCILKTPSDPRCWLNINMFSYLSTNSHYKYEYQFIFIIGHNHDQSSLQKHKSNYINMLDDSPAQLGAGAIGWYSGDIFPVSSHAYMWAVFEGLILYGQWPIDHCTK